MNYQISIETQIIPVPPEIGISDDLTKKCLQPYFPEVANALLTRVEKDGMVTITVTKRAGTKGGWQDLIDIPESRNPVIALQAELKDIHPAQLGMEEILKIESRIDEIVEEGTNQNKSVEFSLKRLQAARPVQSKSVPVGF
jgi:hypothetical protein